MKIFVVSRDGSCAPLAAQMQREGHDVRLYIDRPEYRAEVYEGLVPKASRMAEGKNWANLVVFGENKLVERWKEASTWGVPVYGGSEAGQQLESDRPGAQKLAASFGLKVPRHVSVKTVDEMEAFLTKEKGPFVLKFVGGNTDSDDVLLGEFADNRDLIRFGRFIEQSGKKWDEIEIDQFIAGVEAGVAAYFDGTRFAPGIEVNFQNKRFAAGEGGHGVGFLTGEMGTTIRYVDESNKFFQQVLAPLAAHLRQIGYRGEIDVGTIVDAQGQIWFVEFTPRTGYPDCVIRLPLQVTPLADLFFQVAAGRVVKNEVRMGWSVGVVLVAPGFPWTETADQRARRLPVLGYEANVENCHLFGVKRGDHGLLEVCKASDGYPLVAVARGPSLESARRRAYWVLQRANPQRVCVPKGWYRDDIGARVLRSREEILDLGILTAEEWARA